MRRCTKCGDEKPLRNFAWKKRGVRRATKCKDCHAEYRAKHYQKNKQKYLDKSKVTNQEYEKRFRAFVFQYLSDHQCVNCGFSDIRALGFDHVKGKKRLDVSRMKTYAIETIAREIAKCEIRCANCHRIITSKRRNDQRQRYYISRK